MSKIVLVGANHAGTAAANTILDNYSGNELVIFDRNSNISYLGCGTALWIGRQIEDPNGLFYSSKEQLEAKGAVVHMETEVSDIDSDAKKVYAKSINGETFEESYDELILATGSWPITPRIPGSDLQNVEYVKLFQDGQQINELLDRDDINNVAVVGAGYIGVELVEAIQRRGKHALLFEAENTCLSNYYDPWFTNDMDKILVDNGIELHYAEMVEEIQGNNGKVSGIRTNKGEYGVDVVVLSIGFLPNAPFGTEKIERYKNGAYLVNRQQQTNIPNVYAIGDCAVVYDNATEDQEYIALASNAVRSGIVAGHNVCNTPLESIGVQGSNGICIFGYKMVCTGLSVRGAEKHGMDIAYTDYEDLQKPAFVVQGENYPVKIRIEYDRQTRRIVGAQMASYQDVSMGIHMFSLAIEEGVTIDKLKLTDIFFLPHFNQPYNYITMAALNAK